MDRMFDAWNKIVDWFMEHSGEPLFEMAQGIAIGLLLAAGVCLIVKGLKKEASKDAEK